MAAITMIRERQPDMGILGRFVASGCRCTCCLVTLVSCATAIANEATVRNEIMYQP